MAETLAAIRNEWPMSENKSREIYRTLQKSLQKSDLTINFNAHSWFLQENTWHDYKTMYTQGMQSSGKVVLKDSPLNPVTFRATADKDVTIPKEWERRTGANLFDQRKALQARMAEKMQTGKLTEIATGQWEAGSVQFNPKSMQVFAALNYGRRKHGSNTKYGKSYFVLKPKLKLDALYFPCDTFVAFNGTDAQLSYQTLGAMYLKSVQGNVPVSSRKDLYRACVDGAKLPDTAEADQLIEAHLFREVLFLDIETMYLCREWDVSDGTEGKKTRRLSTQEYAAIRTHAHKFAKKWGCDAFMNESG